MPYEHKIFLDHPAKENVKVTLNELADLLDIDVSTMRVR